MTSTLPFFGRLKNFMIDQHLRNKYSVQKSHARLRNIEWHFDYNSWLAWWGNDIDRRGAGGDALCMARLNDCGVYSPDNCYKATNRQNNKDAVKNGSFVKQHKIVHADGMVFDSVKQCREHYGKTNYFVYHRCKSDNFPDWYMV